jgi:photosystem II stability/assembly factor-like uncharacterized protein
MAFVLTLALAIYGGAQKIEDSYGYAVNTHAVSDLFFLDGSQGWMVVEDHSANMSFLLKTGDGGKSWGRWDAPQGITRLFFLNGKLGWALSSTVAPSGGHTTEYLLRTTNGGKAWTSETIISDAEEAGVVGDLAFINDKLGWAVGNGPTGAALVLVSSDGGATVHSLPGLSKLMRFCRGISASEESGVWIYGDGSLLHSADRGKTWQTAVDLHRLGTDADAFSVSSAFFGSSGRGWLFGQDPEGMILRTEDFGKHWNVSFRSKEVGNFEGVSFWDERHGCAVSFYPVLFFCTKDGGLTWTSRDSLPPARDNQAGFFERLVILKSGQGWALRAGGYLYETSDGGKSWRDVDALTNLTLLEP